MKLEIDERFVAGRGVVVKQAGEPIATFRDRADAELFVRAKENQAIGTIGIQGAGGGCYAGDAVGDGGAGGGSDGGSNGEYIRKDVLEAMRTALKNTAFTSPLQDGAITVAIPAPQPGVQVNVVDSSGVRLLEIPPLPPGSNDHSGTQAQDQMLVDQEWSAKMRADSRHHFVHCAVCGDVIAGGGHARPCRCYKNGYAQNRDPLPPGVGSTIKQDEVIHQQYPFATVTCSRCRKQSALRGNVSVGAQFFCMDCNEWSIIAASKPAADPQPGVQVDLADHTVVKLLEIPPARCPVKVNGCRCSREFGHAGGCIIEMSVPDTDQ